MPGPISQSMPEPDFRIDWVREMKRKDKKYFVLKAEDFLMSLTKNQALAFNSYLRRHERYRLKHGKKEYNDYWVINRDDEGAETVRGIIENNIGRPLKD